ncbi:hypothetical protein FO519_001357 [Halicephalobus sp. NKZ332]|nr:hypothetical protein FO519_001357 [Halicephalobus sp. NKZ332]
MSQFIWCDLNCCLRQYFSTKDTKDPKTWTTCYLAKRECSCKYIISYLPKIPDINIVDNQLLPKITFLKIDAVARRQFYKLCSPILQYTLSRTSRRTNYEAPRIERYVSLLTLFDNDNYNIIHPLDQAMEPEERNINGTYIIDVVDTLNLQSLYSGSLIPYMKCLMSFNHKTLSVYRSHLLEEEFKTMFHPNVENLRIDQSSIPPGMTFLGLLRRMPNLKEVTYHCEQLPSEWDSLMGDYHVGKVESFSIRITHTPLTLPTLLIDPKAIYTFFRRQHDNFTFSISFIRWPVG